MKRKIYFFVILFFSVLSAVATDKANHIPVINSDNNIEVDTRERILNFHSDIKVDTTGRVEVTEKIRVNVTGQSIERGIVRVLPIYRKDIEGKNQRIDFTILSIERDGEDEDYFTNISDDFLEIYIGDTYSYLPDGIYEYTIVYESYGHVGFFDNYDEIYWNVTGNDWAFPIDSVSATIHVPQGAKVLTNSCYTGAKGSKATDCTYTVEGDSVANYISASDLTVGEGFTVATSFTSGIISRPIEPSFSFVQYFKSLLSLPLVLFVLLVGFLSKYMWDIYRRSAKIATIIPSFNPPNDMLPAQLRYLDKAKLDDKALSASLLSLATKGAIHIQEIGSQFTISKVDQITNLESEEKVLMDQLFNEERKTVYMRYKDKTLWQEVYTLWEKGIKNLFNINDYFIDKKVIVNKVRKISIIIMTAWTFILMLFTNLSLNIFNFTSPFFIIGSLIVIFIYFILRGLWKSKSIFKKFIASILILIFIVSATLYVNYWAITLSFETKWTIFFFAVVISFNLLFNKYYIGRTAQGAKLAAEIDGFRIYLKTAEESRLNFFTPSHNTIELFEKMLPYAVALDLEIEWAEKFSNILNNTHYRPLWYEGNVFESPSDFAKSFTQSLTTSTFLSRVDMKSYPEGRSFSSSSSRDRSSSGSSNWSSGSHDGGSSGGGGGGGGGHGW